MPCNIAPLSRYKEVLDFRSRGPVTKVPAGINTCSCRAEASSIARCIICVLSVFPSPLAPTVTMFTASAAGMAVVYRQKSIGNILFISVSPLFQICFAHILLFLAYLAYKSVFDIFGFVEHRLG